jgi:putative DNA primase/helicase
VSFGVGPEDFRQAEWLAERLGLGWRYDFTASTWHHWDGLRWAPDDTNQVLNAVASEAARTLHDGVADEALRKSLIKLLSNGPAERALESLATFPGYGTNGDDWDADANLLGVKNGIVDLRKNELISKPNPDMLVTKTTGVKFTALTNPDYFDRRAPEFMRVMREWMSGDMDMVYFLLFWFGASLFGMSPEQRFLLMTGIGRNGKGALKHSIVKAVGEYGAQFDANLYMRNRFGAARSDAARADLLALKGKRITFFSEPEGNRFNEEMLKAHTGGDMITARALYSNNVQTWEATHSINFLVNNAPEVEDLGPSMAARVMVVDFRERFDGDREDKQLYGKLERESEGILAIMCWAAHIWHQRWSSGAGGLVLPQRVIDQSRMFMERGDPVANCLNERFETGERFDCGGQAAYDAYKDWHAAQGDGTDALSMVMFARALERKGFRKVKREQGMRWLGMRPLGAMALAERGIGE